ncbi:hypothetical protein BBJ28_00002756 [Nothophytophthora sp. Chile5]|nr:hypothetical protein BBJ28_00002756 [Nothophytophthora sp. Chile5]
MGRSVAAVICAGASVRAALYALPSLQTTLADRPELVTAVSSFRRVQEGAFLFERTDSPYAGDVFHQPPLVFAAFYPLVSLAPPALRYALTCVAFICVDVLIAAGFARLCRRTLQLEEGRVRRFQGQEIWLSRVPVSPLLAPNALPATVAFIYLLNPYSLASSVAMSTASLTHLALIYSLVFAAEGAIVASMLCVAGGVYLSVYPFFLIVPIVLLLRAAKSPKNIGPNDDDQSEEGTRSLVSLSISCFVAFGVWLGLLLYLSWSLSGDWEFLEETYVWVAKYSDLTPNVGIFWYFFMEVFDRFIPYFLFVMHLHPCIYVVPIYLRMAMGIVGAFCGYLHVVFVSLPPSIAIENRFAYVLGLGVATCMLPVMWFLWLFPASGNANFFYNQTLVYQIFNSQIITAFVGASMKRDKDVQKYRAARLQEVDAVKES